MENMKESYMEVEFVKNLGFFKWFNISVVNELKEK